MSTEKIRLSKIKNKMKRKMQSIVNIQIHSHQTKTIIIIMYFLNPLHTWHYGTTTIKPNKCQITSSETTKHKTSRLAADYWLAPIVVPVLPSWDGFDLVTGKSVGYVVVLLNTARN